MSEYNFIIDYFNQFPLIIKVVWIVSIILMTNVFVLIIYLRYLRNKLRVKSSLESKCQLDFESSLITYLYSGNEEEEFSIEQKKIIKELKGITSDTFKRKVLITTLLKLRNEITGEIADSIDKLYIELGLLQYPLRKLRHKKWDVVANSIRELTLFQVKGIQSVVMKNINHPKKEVRKEMQLYLVQLFTFKGLDFLNLLQTPLSEWDQIQLLEILQKSDDQDITDIKPWLKSTNESVVSFALKLAKLYNQYEVKDEIIALLNHINEQIRVVAIETLSHLNVLEAKEVLKYNFMETSLDEQIAFVKMLENTYESTDKSFLLKYSNHENQEIKLIIMEIMKDLNFEEYYLYHTEVLEVATNKKLTA